MSSLNLRTSSIATEERMEVDVDPKCSYEHHLLGTATGASASKLLPCSLLQTRPSTSEAHPASEIKNVSIFPSNGSQEKSAASATKRGGEQPGHDGAKQPRR